MGATTIPSSPQRGTDRRSTEQRKVLAGTMVGTTIEWYDFFVYAQAAGIVLGPLFFAPLVQERPELALIMSFATIGVSFLFRPLGAIIVGRLGDRVGRKRMLVLTLMLMGMATVAIGLLPTYEQIGVAAVFLLVLMRILQGFSAGGEWGGAVLMSVEHAPPGKRGLFGAYPQIGVPAGMILASGVLFAVQASMSREDFLAYGWRVPFLLSFLLIIVGVLIRRTVEESPVFVQMHRRAKEASAPLGQLVRKHWRDVIKSALTFAGNNASGYMVIAFFGSYAIAQGMPGPGVTLALTLAAFGWLVFTMAGGAWSDRWGRVRTHQIGYLLIIVTVIPVFLLTGHAAATGSLLVFGLAMLLLMPGQGLSYGPTSSLYAELYPAQVRYSGVALAYAIGSIVGGAFAPMIAQALLQGTGSLVWVGVYIAISCTISLIAVSLLPETKDRALEVGVEYDSAGSLVDGAGTSGAPADPVPVRTGDDPGRGSGPDR